METLSWSQRASQTARAGAGTSMGRMKTPWGGLARREAMPLRMLANIGSAGLDSTVWTVGPPLSMPARTSGDTTQVASMPAAVRRSCWTCHHGRPPTSMRALGVPMRRPPPAARMRARWSLASRKLSCLQEELGGHGDGDELGLLAGVADADGAVDALDGGLV